MRENSAVKGRRTCSEIGKNINAKLIDRFEFILPRFFRRNMRVSVVIVAIAMVVSCHAMSLGEESPKKQELTDMFEKVRDMFKNGHDDLGLPVLDPFHAPELKIDIERKLLLKLNVLLNDVNLEGLSSFKLEHSQRKGFSVAFGLSWQKVQARTGYSGTGKITGIDLHGTGDISAILKNLKVDLKVALTVKNRKFRVKSIESGFSLEGLNFNISGLFDDEIVSRLISHVVSDITPGLIDDYQEYLTGMVNKEATEFLDDFLKDKSLKDILDLLG